MNRRGFVARAVAALLAPLSVGRAPVIVDKPIDLRKLHGSNAEMYWRGTFPAGPVIDGACSGLYNVNR